jgi:hypothetical protein
MMIESDDAQTTPGRQFINKILLDAFEQRTLAIYTWMSSDTKKYWEVKPVICKLSPANQPEQPCTSEEDFNAFVATYMD